MLDLPGKIKSSGSIMQGTSQLCYTSNVYYFIICKPLQKSSGLQMTKVKLKKNILTYFINQYEDKQLETGCKNNVLQKNKGNKENGKTVVY
jgi:hypothetical protein